MTGGSKTIDALQFVAPWLSSLLFLTMSSIIVSHGCPHAKGSPNIWLLPPSTSRTKCIELNLQVLGRPSASMMIAVISMSWLSIYWYIAFQECHCCHTRRRLLHYVRTRSMWMQWNESFSWSLNALMRLQLYGCWQFQTRKRQILVVTVTSGIHFKERNVTYCCLPLMAACLCESVGQSLKKLQSAPPCDSFDPKVFDQY